MVEDYCGYVSEVVGCLELFFFVDEFSVFFVDKYGVSGVVIKINVVGDIGKDIFIVEVFVLGEEGCK